MVTFDLPQTLTSAEPSVFEKKKVGQRSTQVGQRSPKCFFLKKIIWYYKFQEKQLGRSKVTTHPTTTVVLRARTQAQVNTAEQWKQCRQLNTPVTLRKYFKDSFPHLHVEDIFRVEGGQQELTFLIRVHTPQQQKWLAAQDIPFSFAPTGDSVQQFRVAWDRETSTLQGLQKKCSHIAGYSGPVLSSKGIGARFKEEDLSGGKTESGFGDWRSLPCHWAPGREHRTRHHWVDEGAPMGCHPLQGSRRVKGRMAQVRVRSQSTPPSTVLKVTWGREISTVYIQEAATAPPQQRKPEPQQQPSRTWAEALRSTLARDTERTQTTPKQAPEKVTPPWIPTRKKTQWTDQHDDRDSDQDMEQSTDSEESFVPWDLFEEAPAENVDIDDDQHIEGAPKRKRARKTHKKSQAQTKGKRLKLLEQGMVAMQVQMSELVGALSRQQLVQMKTGPQRGTMQWSERVMLPAKSQIAVPHFGSIWLNFDLVFTNPDLFRPIAPGGPDPFSSILTYFTGRPDSTCFVSQWGSMDRTPNSGNDTRPGVQEVIRVW